jgi:putative ABC transport system permease protein
MRLLRGLRISLRALLAHRARSVLAATGVAVGIAAVFVSSAVGEGARAEVLQGLGTMGTRLLVVRPARIKKTTVRKEISGFVTSLTQEDALAIEGLPAVASMAPIVEGAVKIKNELGVVATKVLGTTSAFFRARSFELEEGRLFDEEEDRGLSRVAVLGGRLGRALFAGKTPVGQSVRLGGVAFEVIGQLRAKGVAADGADADNQVFVPVRTALRRVFNSRSLTAIFIGVQSSEELLPVERAIRSLLGERHHRRADFEIQNQLRVLMAQRETDRWLTLLTSGLAAVSLLIGGTGILALMLLSVQERAAEVGLRRALGARPRDILFQFLAEAVVLAVAGGLAGIALGALSAWLVSLATQWPTRVSPAALLLSLATAAGVGLVFGVLPARRAALLPPVRALGME